ncbi:uncharacterized protein HaLaN_19419 [Haematococcus lacustris]|uniref:Uncharacterized protein n=1 Tax=Haematococcus lacustris TaxID=44745 RepID=A0A699ZLQ7_HAELA|nr:uncharacterized protein HaLaN_19419 [Haematococcus lacustris]
MYLPWATDQDEELMLRRLRSGQLRALVLDAPWVQYTTALCSDLFITGETVLPVNLGFAFPGDTPDSYLAAFDSALAALDDDGVMDRLQRRFIRPPNTCHT